MITPAELFDRAGRALYGDHYVAPMAALLGVEKNTVGKWRSGKSTVPLDVWRRIAAELLNRGAAIDAVTVPLAEHIKAELQMVDTRT